MLTRKVLPTLLGVVLVVSGCTGAVPGIGHGDVPRTPVIPAPTFQTYVALGDSYTAGPFVPTTDLAGGCFRSDGNYPSLVAKRLRVADFTDVSCSGASTRDMTGPQHTFQDASIPPQLRAVTADTDLVTMGIGGNDFDLFGTLVRTCTGLRVVDPTGSPCADQLASQGIDLETRTTQIGNRVARSISEVRRLAPQATIVLVGYLRLAPSGGNCPRLLPLAKGDLALADRVARDLEVSLARAAARTDVGFVDMRAASQGHDVCSKDPWVNGRRTDRAAAFAYHPFAAGMEATARRVLSALR